MWGWGEGERGGGGWWSWTVGDQRIGDDQRIVCSTDRIGSTDRMIESQGEWRMEGRGVVVVVRVRVRGEGEREGFTTLPYPHHTPPTYPPTTHPPTTPPPPTHPTLPRSMVGRATTPTPPCPSPPPYYCDLTSHGQHRTPPLTYIGLGLNLSARLEQQLHYWVMALHCRVVQGGEPGLGEEWGVGVGGE